VQCQDTGIVYSTLVAYPFTIELRGHCVGHVIPRVIGLTVVYVKLRT